MNTNSPNNFLISIILFIHTMVCNDYGLLFYFVFPALYILNFCICLCMYVGGDDFWIFWICEIEGLRRVRSTKEEGKSCSCVFLAFLFPGGENSLCFFLPAGQGVPTISHAIHWLSGYIKILYHYLFIM